MALKKRSTKDITVELDGVVFTFRAFTFPESIRYLTQTGDAFFNTVLGTLTKVSGDNKFEDGTEITARRVFELDDATLVKLIEKFKEEYQGLKEAEITDNSTKKKPQELSNNESQNDLNSSSTIQNTTVENT